MLWQMRSAHFSVRCFFLMLLDVSTVHRQRHKSSKMVHKFIPMPQALKIPDAKAAVEKEVVKLEKIPTWQLTKVRNKKR